MDVTLHGIASCDTVRKARRWLDGHGVAYAFHDLRKDGLDVATLERWAGTLDDWGVLLNRRGTTWRTLDADAKEDLDEASALRLMAAHPTLVKRPVLERGELVLVGFDDTLYTKLLSA